MKTKSVDSGTKLRSEKLVLKRRSIIRRVKQTQTKTLLLSKVSIDNK